MVEHPGVSGLLDEPLPPPPEAVGLPRGEAGVPGEGPPASAGQDAAEVDPDALSIAGDGPSPARRGKRGRR